MSRAAPAKTARRLTRLREDLARGQAPLAAGAPRVDRAAGVIYGVKVVGRESPNTHGQPGATKGTRYEEAALREALPLYSCAVNVNHPPRRRGPGPAEDRDATERLGRLVNPRVVGGETYADLELLKTHPMAERLMEAAERMPDAFALSHHAYGSGRVVGGWYVIDHIARVDSVDVVADGGTNSTLFEAKAVSKTLAEFLEAAPPKKFWKLRKLLEMDDGYGTAAVDEGEGPDEMDHLYQAFKRCLQEDPEKANKILALLKAEKPEDLEDEDDEDEGGKQAMEESRKRCARLARGYLQLREGEKVPQPLIEALAKLPDEDSRLSLLESWPRGAPPQQQPRRGAPRSAAPYDPAPLRESRPAKDAEDLAAILLK